MDMVSQFAAVAGVLVLLAASLWWLRRRGFAVAMGARRTAGRRLECLERLPLGPQHTLHLIKLGDTVLLVASSPSGCALIHGLSDREMGHATEALR